MKRDIIIIEDKSVSVTGNDVWMTAGEIAGLFHTGVPAVNAAIKAILKTDVLNDYEVSFSIKSDVNVFFFSDNLPKPLKKLNFGKLLDWITCQNRLFFVILASY